MLASFGGSRKAFAASCQVFPQTIALGFIHAVGSSASSEVSSW
jgi:hypothetical protein